MAQLLRRVAAPVDLVVLRVLGQGLEFVAFVLLARRLGTSSFGSLAVAVLTCRYLGIVADWGASVRGVRDVARGEFDAADALISRRMVVTAMAALPYVLVTIGLRRPEFAVLAAIVANRGLNLDWVALGRGDRRRAGAPSAIQGIVVLAAVVVLPRPDLAALAIGLAYGVSLAASLMLNRSRPRGEGRKTGGAPWILFAILAEQVLSTTDTIVLAALRSTREAGIYAAMYRIPNALLMVLGLLILAALPAAARATEDRTEVRRLRDVALRRGLTGSAVIILVIPPLIWSARLLFGRDYADGAEPLAILLVATAITALAAPLHPLYISLANDRAQAAATCAVAALNVVLNFLIIPDFGMVGAATSTLISQLILCLVFIVGVTRAKPSRVQLG